VTTICPGYIATPMTQGNPYRMPFLMDADDASRKIAGAIARRESLTLVVNRTSVSAAIVSIAVSARIRCVRKSYPVL